MKYLLPQHTRHKCTFPNIIPHLIYNLFFINYVSAGVMPFNNLIFKLNQTLYYHPEIVLWSLLSCWQQITEFIWAEIQCHKLSWKISSTCFLHTEPRLDDTGIYKTDKILWREFRFMKSLVCFPIPILWMRPLKTSLPISCDKAKNL